MAYKKLNKKEEVIINYKKAIELNPQNYSALYNLSLFYKDNNDIQSAISCAEKCLEIKNDDEEIYTLLSGFYEEIGDIDTAILTLRRAILLNNRNSIYFYNLGVLLSRKSELYQAETAYLKAIELDDKYIEAYINLASIIKEKDNNRALELLEKAYEINPQNEKLTLSLAQTYRTLYENDKSLKILYNLIKSQPQSAEAYSQIAINYMDKCEYYSALENYEKAINIVSDNPNYMHGKAIALKYLGKVKEAIALMEIIVNNKNSSIQSSITLGMMYLTEKDFTKGMPLYSLRSKESKFKDIFKDKIWSVDTDIKGKNILLYSDCGLGDTIMYSRFLPIIKDLANKIVLQTDKDLVSILQRSFKDILIIPKSKKYSAYDIVIPLMDIQYALNMGFDKLQKPKPYIIPDKKLVSEYSKLKIFDTCRKKVGLFWQGNKRVFKNRSIDFSYIDSLVKCTDCTFYSLQIDEKINESDKFYNIKKYIKDYDDTAAILKNLDLVITIDSSIAHMAGALGIKTYLLLPKTAEWRWFDDDKKTIWYNNVRIFRQKEINNWQEVLERVVNSI